MTFRSALAAAFLVLVAASAAVELSTWVLGRAVAAIVPASVSEVNAEVPSAPEVDVPVPW